MATVLRAFVRNPHFLPKSLPWTTELGVNWQRNQKLNCRKGKRSEPMCLDPVSKKIDTSWDDGSASGSSARMAVVCGDLLPRALWREGADVRRP